VKRPKSEIFRVNKEGNLLKFHNRAKLDLFLESVEDGELMITIEEIHSRTRFQNDYYWSGVIGKPGKEGTLLDSEAFSGYTPNEMHEALKGHFKIASTSKLNTDEFSDYITDIIVWASSKFQVAIKDPND